MEKLFETRLFFFKTLVLACKITVPVHSNSSFWGIPRASSFSFFLLFLLQV